LVTAGLGTGGTGTGVGGVVGGIVPLDGCWDGGEVLARRRGEEVEDEEEEEREDGRDDRVDARPIGEGVLRAPVVVRDASLDVDPTIPVEMI
jgi:hypothetical protein